MITDELISHLKNQNLWVLRRKKDNFALGVSYTPTGLI